MNFKSNSRINFNDDVDHRLHENEDVVLQRIYQNAAGYHADDEDDLRLDSLFQTILEKEILVSQPTISRLNSQVNKENMKQLQQANFNLLDIIYEIEPPE